MQSQDVDESKSGTRKIQTVGGGSFSVSLPIGWVRDHRVAQQETLDYVISSDGKLSFIPADLTPEDTKVVIKSVSSKTPPDTVLRRIISAILWAYNEIHVISEDELTPPQRKKIREFFSRRTFLGCRTVEISAKELVVRADVSYDSYGISSSLKDMVTKTQFMCNEVNEILKGNKKLEDAGAYMTGLDDDVDGIYLYLVRAIKACSDDERLMIRMGLETGRDCLGYRIVTRHVERVADHLTYVGKTLGELLSKKEKIPDFLKSDLQDFGVKACCSFGNVMEAFFEKNYDKADKEIHWIDNDFIKRQNEYESVYGALRIANVMNENLRKEKLNAAIGCQLASLIQGFLRVAQNSKGIGQIVLNLNFKKTLETT